MSIEQKRDQLIEELMPFEDPLERFAYVIDRAKDAPGLEDEYKIETFLIKGCISQLWVFPKFENDSVFFRQTPTPLSPRVPPPCFANYTVEKPPKKLSDWNQIFYPRSASPSIFLPTAEMDSPVCGTKSNPMPSTVWT